MLNFETKKCILTKISDDKFNGKHPNGINENFSIAGIVKKQPTVGESFVFGSLHTSTVTEVLENGVFKTLNSTYMLKIKEMTASEARHRLISYHMRPDSDDIDGHARVIAAIVNGDIKSYDDYYRLTHNRGIHSYDDLAKIWLLG